MFFIYVERLKKITIEKVSLLLLKIDIPKIRTSDPYKLIVTLSRYKLFSKKITNVCCSNLFI